MSKKAIAELAATIAQDPRLDVLKNVTNQWIEIIEKLLTLRMQDPAIHHLAKYGFDDKQGSHDEELIGSQRTFTRIAVEKAGIQTLEKSSLDAITAATLDGIRNASDETINAVNERDPDDNPYQQSDSEEGYKEPTGLLQS